MNGSGSDQITRREALRRAAWLLTDGACLASSAHHNPSLTYMALTPRAADYAVAELKRRNL